MGERGTCVEGPLETNREGDCRETETDAVEAPETSLGRRDIETTGEGSADRPLPGYSARKRRGVTRTF